MRKNLIFPVALSFLLLFVSACVKEQKQQDNPFPTKGDLEVMDEMNENHTHEKHTDSNESRDDEQTNQECPVSETDIDYIFSHLQPNMPRSEVVKLFGHPCAETYTLLYADYSVEWRYDFGQADHYDAPYSSGDFSYVDEQGLYSGAIAAQVFIGWNENDTVKYAEVNYMKDGEITTEMILPEGWLEDNQFFIKTVRPGDVISGLTVETVEPFYQIQGAAAVHFTGEIELSGSYKYYTDDEKAMEQYDLYIYLDEQSIQSIPMVHHNVPDLTFMGLGVTNADDFSEQIQRTGKEGRFKGTFTNFTIRFALFKPAEDTIQGKEIYFFAE